MNDHSLSAAMFHTEIKDGVLELTMARPPVNAINGNWIEAFSAVLDGLADSREVAAVLIRSAERVFSAGADLKLMRECFASDEGPDRMVETVRRMQRLYDRIEALPQVTIAEIGGPAYGGGFELALACDLRIAAETASVGLPEARLGLLPGAGGTQRLSRLAGPGITRRLILTAEVLDGRQAQELGLVQWVVSAAELVAFTREIAERVVTMSPAALAACKHCFSAADAALHDGMLIELLETHKLLNTADTRKRVAAFLDR
jgi:enoyl-CoA hydratase/carnithine racemase